MNGLQISHKTQLLLAVALAALVIVGGFAWYQTDRLNTAMMESHARHQSLVHAIDHGRSAQVEFKTQVQQWKNILLRGKSQEAFDKHLKEFDEHGKRVKENLTELKKHVADLGLDKEIKVDDIISTMDKLNSQYHDALKQFDRESADPGSTVDKLVKGMDRPPTEAIDKMVELVDKRSEEAAKEEQERAAQLRSSTRTGILIVEAIAIVLTLLLASIVIKSINAPLKNLEGTMEQIARTKDLTLRARVENQDEIGRMAMAFNGMVNTLQDLVRHVATAATQLNHASGELADGVNTLNRSVEEQSATVSASAASIEELTVSIATVADTASDVRNKSAESVRNTSEGNRKVAELVSEIRSIQDRVTEIGTAVEEFVRSTSAITGMTQEVRDIADQTNLLALNAAIEAARAGEQGRGFAVVADEVRKLAEKSGSSAGEIDGVAKSIMHQTESVRRAIDEGRRAIEASAGLASDVESTLNQARSSVEQAGTGVGEIATAVAEQRNASNEIAKNMETISSSSEESSRTANTVASTANQLSEAADDLHGLIADFRV